MQTNPLRHLRRNAVAYLALFVALGGTSFAAATVITGKNVKNSSLTGKDVKNSSLTGGDVKNESLSASDFNGSVQGPKGDAGLQGPKGDTGANGTNGTDGTDGTDATINGVAAGGDLTGTYPNPVIGNGAVTGAKVADGTLRLGDVFTRTTTFPIDFDPIPANSCTGSTTNIGVGGPGNIAFSFTPPTTDPLIGVPTLVGTAGMTRLRVCNVGTTTIDPPLQSYTVYTMIN